MFDTNDIQKLKDKHKEEINNKKNQKKPLSKLNEYLNTFDYKEFMSFYIPKNVNEIKYLIKPLPFINIERNNIEGISINFSKHLSKDIKLNCLKNIQEECPICDSSVVKKFDFVIFPVFVLSNSATDFYKKQIKLIEVSLNDWENYIYPDIEKYYTSDLIINLTLKKDGYNYQYTYKNENFKINELTKEEILNKSFIYDTTTNSLHNEKAYVKDFNLELNKKDIIVSEIPY